MSTKFTSKIALVLICVLVSLTVCSCTEGINPVQEVQNITNFATDILDTASSLSNSEMTEEQKLEQIESLFHPASGLTLEIIQEDLQNNEKLKEITSANSVEIISMPTVEELASLVQYDEELGGCVYTAEVQVSVDGVIVTLDLSLFSDANGMGIYSYEIK